MTQPKHKPTRTTRESFESLNSRRADLGLPLVRPVRETVTDKDVQQRLQPGQLISESLRKTIQ